MNWLFNRIVYGTNSKKTNAASSQDAFRQDLCRNGEEFATAADAPYLLCLARAILVPEEFSSVIPLSPEFETSMVWALRCARVHQDFLLAPSSDLRSMLLDIIIPMLVSRLSDKQNGIGSLHQELRSRILLEISAVYARYWNHGMYTLISLIH